MQKKYQENRAKRHHIVPEFLIRNFYIDGTNKTAAMIKNKKIVRPTTEKDIAVESEYNTSPLDNDKMAKERIEKIEDTFVKAIANIERFAEGKTLEKILENIETDTAPILTRILKTGKLTRDAHEKKQLILFKNILEARNRALKEHIKCKMDVFGKGKELFDMTFALILNKLIKMHDGQEHDHIQVTLCKAEGREFCLSDNPVLSKRTMEHVFDFDFNQFLPISPKYALMFNDRNELDISSEIGNGILNNANIIVEELRVHCFNILQIQRAYWHVCFSDIAYAESYLFALNNKT